MAPQPLGWYPLVPKVVLTETACHDPETGDLGRLLGVYSTIGLCFRLRSRMGAHFPPRPDISIGNYRTFLSRFDIRRKWGTLQETIEAVPSHQTVFTGRLLQPCVESFNILTPFPGLLREVARERPMGGRHNSSRDRAPSFERCEERILSTLVFVLNGNAYSAASPNILTANAAQVLWQAGNQAVQLAYSTMATPAAFFGLERQIQSLSHGQPIGIVGFSAGGTLALKIATDKALRVVSVLDYYGPPDLKDYFLYHKSDRFSRYILGHVPFTRAAINLLSGPIATNAHVACAFGLRDANVVASQSAASLNRDLPQASIYTYDGPHGVGINACQPALNDFLANL